MKPADELIQEIEALPDSWPVRAESEARAVHNAIKAEFRRRGLYAGAK